MKLKTVTARTMPEAMALVRRELGSGAVILSTRQYKLGGFLGIGAQLVVEVIAADGTDIGRRNATASAARRRGQLRPRRAAPTQAGAGDLIRRTYDVARADLQAKQAAPPPPPAARPDDADDLAQEVRAVKHLVEQMTKQQQRQNAGQPDLPEKLFDQYLGLVRQEVTEELAVRIVEQVRADLDENDLDDAQAVQLAVQNAVADLIPTDQADVRLQRTDDGGPRTVALIGPTGVGKTTTIAKLAATFKLKHGKNVGLVTLDTYRIAAVEQLRTYANIIGLPLHVATTADELTSALSKMRGCDIVFIDTAGRSPKDDPKLEQLKTMISVANPHEVHLVLSSTCTQTVLLDAIERFSSIRADRIIFTKLDEAVSFGVLLNVVQRVNKRLSYVTTGQEVPHQIEPGQPQRLAKLVMGDKI